MRNDEISKNEVQDALEEYLGRRKAKVLSKELQEKINTETRHMHMDKVFFVSKNEKGELVSSRESKIKDSVKEILRKNLEKEEDVEECFKHIMKKTLLTEVRTNRGFETIYVDGSDSCFYDEQLSYDGGSSFGGDKDIKIFQDDLRNAIRAKIRGFEVPVCDMSINEKGEPCFIPGKKTATNLSFNEIQQLAKKNNLKLGNKHQYVLFLATMIERIKIEMNVTTKDAMNMVCKSSKIGNYSLEGYQLEKTGSRRIAGKCDITNVKKIFAFDSKAGIAGVYFKEYNSHDQIAMITAENDLDKKIYSGVGWFVFQ